MFNFRLFALPLICESEFGVHEADCLKASRALPWGCEGMQPTACHGPLWSSLPVVIDERQSRGLVVSRLDWSVVTGRANSTSCVLQT